MHLEIWQWIAGLPEGHMDRWKDFNALSEVMHLAQ